MILKKSQKRAYSLAEFSIVITIVSILVSGGLVVATSSANNVKIQLTKDRMTEIYKAMGAYLVSHGSLPCPAPLNAIKSTDTAYGSTTGADGSCAATGVFTRATGIVTGMVPVQNLGLPTSYAEDGFGSKFTYSVAMVATSTRSTTGFGSASTTGIITVNDNVSGVTQLATSDAVFVLVSHGVNKYGAYDKNSTTQNSTSSDADEMTNHGTINTSAGTNIFVASATASDLFDDIVTYKTRNTLVTDFDALDLIYCQAGGAQTTSDGISHTWPLTGYNVVSPANEDCASGWTIRNIRPLKKCGAFGVWESDVMTDCFNS